MDQLILDQSLEEIEKQMSFIAPHRNPVLFREFLIKGYRATTLSSVSKSLFTDALNVKLCLGTLITLYDDFADRPQQQNPALLEALYKFKFGTLNSIMINEPNHKTVISFASFLFQKMNALLSSFPNYLLLTDILNFDLLQFYTANRFSSLATAHPELNNLTENQVYCHHNMGIVICGTIDLMASETLKMTELGLIREFLLVSQRLGRIINVLHTYNREITEGDTSSELAICNNNLELQSAKQKLEREAQALFHKIHNYHSLITQFSIENYSHGLRELELLHKKLDGLI